MINNLTYNYYKQHIDDELTKTASDIKYHQLWGDITKGIAIILVIAGHSSFSLNINKFIYSFHMPLFFLLAGYFFNFSKYKNNFKLLVQSSGKRLLLPALLANLFFFNFNCKNFFNNLFIILYSSGINVLKFKNSVGAAWFLPCLFLVRIFLWLFLKLTEKFKTNDFINCLIAFAITGIGVFIGQYVKLPWSLDISLAVLYISYIGYLLNKYSYFKKRILLIITIISAIICSYIEYNQYSFPFELNNRIYTNPLLSINTAIGLSIIVIEFSMLLEKIKITYLNLFLKYLGINSLIILLVHGLAYSHKSALYCTLWRLFISIIIIEILALIPATKKIFSAVSIVSVFKEYKQNKSI